MNARPGDGDRDGKAGEDDGAPRRRSCLGCGLLLRPAVVEQLSESRHDEERVVDPDPEPDHRNEDRRDRVDLRHARENEQQQEGGHQGDDRERDRDQHRNERAEHDEEHDDRREQAQHLGGTLLDGRELGVAVELHRHAGRLDRLADGVLHRENRLPVLVLDRLVELRLGVRDPAVVRERRVVERVTDARQAGGSLRRLELVRLETRNRLVDRGLSLGRVEALACRRREDDVENASLLRGELCLEEIGRLLGVGPRNRELVLKRATDGRDQHDQRCDDPDPREDDTPGVVGARAHPTGERATRRPLMG